MEYWYEDDSNGMVDYDNCRADGDAMMIVAMKIIGDVDDGNYVDSDGDDNNVG